MPTTVPTVTRLVASPAFLTNHFRTMAVLGTKWVIETAAARTIPKIKKKLPNCLDPGQANQAEEHQDAAGKYDGSAADPIQQPADDKGKKCVGPEMDGEC